MKIKARVGILAGGGPLPACVARSLQAEGRDVFIIGFKGFAEEALLAPFPHKMFRLAAAGGILAALREQSCSELVLIGPVKRPSWRDMRPDGEGVRLLGRLGRAVFLGDDGLLAAIINLLEEEGFHVRGAHEYLVGSDDAIVAQYAGAYGRWQPDEQAFADIRQAVQNLTVMGALDIGQGCVVQNGLTLAVEALEGTDAMLRRCAALKQDAPGGVLVKMPKKGQELRVDMPAIGPITIREAAKSGLRGLAFPKGATLVMGYKECITEADRLGLFLYGLTPDELLC